MKANLHHAHLFASNVDESIKFYQEMFDAEILFDLKLAGARNAMITIGYSKINFYDQPPKDNGKGAVHHLGIETDNLSELVNYMENKGFVFKNSIKDTGLFKYVMVEAPDHVLLEIFEVKKDKIPEDMYKKISNFNL